MTNIVVVTLQGTNISPKEWHFEDDFPFPKVGYVRSPWSPYHFDLKELTLIEKQTRFSLLLPWSIRRKPQAETKPPSSKTDADLSSLGPSKN